MDLALVPNLKMVHGKVKDLITELQEIHKATIPSLQDLVAKYEASAGKKRRAVEFEEGDFVWVILTKDRFPLGEYNMDATRMIGLVEIIEKINSNAYRLKLPSRIMKADVFNVKHLVLFMGDTSDEDVYSRAKSLKLGDDVDRTVNEVMKKTRVDKGIQMRSLTRSSELNKKLWETSSRAHSKSQFKLDLERGASWDFQ